MRRLAAFSATALLSLNLATPSVAGLLELPFDKITLHKDCSIEPCRYNGLHTKRVWVQDQYLRYDIHTTAPQYGLRRVQVMVSPPQIAVTGGSQWVWDKWGARRLVAFPTGPYTVVRPPQYQWVTQQVLVHPAQTYVTRRLPYYAYYPETIVVSQP
jgi:hypothetical protein